MNKLRKFPFMATLIIIIAALFTGCGQSGANAKISKQLELAVKYLSENKFEEAVLAYQEVIKIDRKNVLAYKGMSIAYSMQGKMDQAEQALQNGLKQVPDAKPLKLALAGLMIDLNKKDQAEAIYKEIISLDAKYLPAYQAYAKLLIIMNRQNEAVALLERAVLSNAEQYKSQALLAEMYLKSGYSQKALEAINKSLTIEPNQSVSYKLLVEIYSNRWTEFVALGDQFVQQGLYIPGQIIKIYGLYKMGKFDEIIEQYEKLANDVKASPKVRLIAAQAYLKVGNKEKGFNALKDLKIEDIKDAALLAEIASYYLEAGDKDTARRLAIQGISLDETVIENYVVLYRSYLEEDESQADIWLTKYLLNSILSLEDAKKEIGCYFV
ncbi:putative Zn-dependent protease [Desulfofundulus luciae]|uniref:Zn-dependent protease n=1 Tax=Desulfofundulus luciae TaxID=74702 RepID=A0ABU0B4T3_9FIRM|nr:tetratricopeptide repeat protein [Desulfofundulus luciae]MDQ0287729.1 putative Zn-dependent protease [Desulfofundulus luciae]